MWRGPAHPFRTLALPLAPTGGWAYSSRGVAGQRTAAFSRDAPTWSKRANVEQKTSPELCDQNQASNTDCILRTTSWAVRRSSWACWRCCVQISHVPSHSFSASSLLGRSPSACCRGFTESSIVCGGAILVPRRCVSPSIDIVTGLILELSSALHAAAVVSLGPRREVALLEMPQIPLTPGAPETPETPAPPAWSAAWCAPCAAELATTGSMGMAPECGSACALGELPRRPDLASCVGPGPERRDGGGVRAALSHCLAEAARADAAWQAATVRSEEARSLMAAMRAALSQPGMSAPWRAQ